MSIAGGVHLALQRGLSIGCRAVQIFTHSQLQWAAPPLKAEEIEAFRALLPRFAVVFAHGSYLLNLASPDPALFRRSVAGLAEELRRCRLLGIGLLVLHPGAHMGSGPAAGIRRLARGIREAYRRAEAAEVTLALETTSGRGTILGRRFEELRDILDLRAARPRRGAACASDPALERLRRQAGLRCRPPRPHRAGAHRTAGVPPDHARPPPFPPGRCSGNAQGPRHAGGREEPGCAAKPAARLALAP
jgi:hypothetical protein